MKLQNIFRSWILTILGVAIIVFGILAYFDMFNEFIGRNVGIIELVVIIALGIFLMLSSISTLKKWSKKVVEKLPNIKSKK